MKARRLSAAEEEEIFHTQSDNQNMENFFSMLYRFYLSEPTEYRLKTMRLDPKIRATEKALKLNHQHRAWFDIEVTEETDSGYQVYKDMIDNKFRYDRRFLTNSIFNSIPRTALLSEVMKYENYKSNTITINKQKIKLMKFLLNQNILRNFDVDCINNLKLPTNMYLCISRNPIDYLFCSTNQSFTSCQDEYTGLPGLGGLILDPNRFMVFITRGKVTRHRLTQTEIFKHFRYINRTWCLLGKDSSVLPIRSYPSEFNFVSALKSIGYNAIGKKEIEYSRPRRPIRKIFESKYWFNIARYKNGEPSIIYLDLIGIKYDKTTKKYTYTSCNGMLGYSVVFTAPRYAFREIGEAHSVHNSYYTRELECYYCGIRLTGDTAYFVEGSNDFVCEDCYRNYRRVRRCSGECGRMFTIDHLRRGEICYICDTCN